MNFYVYILQSEKDQSFYIGQTNNNCGLEKYTSKKMPWKIFWKAEVSSRGEAMRRG
jgi:putative endonuclease